MYIFTEFREEKLRPVTVTGKAKVSKVQKIFESDG